MHRVRLVVHGRVQGVGFRSFAVRRARELELTGRVRNCGDGTVEVEAEGAPNVLEKLIEALRRGPQGSRVQRVEESWAEGPPAYHGFEVSG
jgi:acylphosphatase